MLTEPWSLPPRKFVAAELYSTPRVNAESLVKGARPAYCTLTVWLGGRSASVTAQRGNEPCQTQIARGLYVRPRPDFEPREPRGYDPTGPPSLASLDERFQEALIRLLQKSKLDATVFRSARV